MKCILVLLLILAGVPLPGQYQRSRRPKTGQQSGTKKPAPDEAVLPSFAGILTAIDGKKLTLKRADDENSIDFHCSRKTKYYDGSKQIKASALKPGDHVSVEAKEAPDASLDAVNVRRSTAQ